MATGRGAGIGSITGERGPDPSGGRRGPRWRIVRPRPQRFTGPARGGRHRTFLRPGLTALVLCLLVVLGLARTAGAQGLQLGVSPGQTIYYPGERLEITLAAVNAAGPGTADFYAGILLPDGVTVVTLGGGTLRFGTLANPGGFVPVATGIGLGGAFSVSVDPFFQYVWTGGEPRGTYTVFLAAFAAGSLRDDRIDGGDLLALRLGTLSLRDPATVTPDPGPPAVFAMDDTGGNIDVAGGHGPLSLAVPAGALLSGTSISARAIAGVAGLPIRRLFGAVQFGPDGTRFTQPATLTVPIPPGVAPAGLVGFAMKDDGTGYETLPVTISGGNVSVRLGHFTGAGVAEMVCGPGVTSSVGLAACARMNQDLQQAAVMIDDLASFPMPVRVLLAAELLQELRTWLTTLILPELRAAADALNTDPTAHYFMKMAVREKFEVDAILQMTEMLDPASGLETEIGQADALIPQALNARRVVANAECLANKPSYLTQIARILEIDGMAQTLGLPTTGAAHGVTCVTIDISVSLAPVVPTAGAPLVATSTPRFSDGADLPDVFGGSLEVFSLGAILEGPTRAESPSRTQTLSTTVKPLSATSVGPTVQLVANVPGLAIGRVLRVSRPNRVLLTSTNVHGEKFLRAGSTQGQFALDAGGFVTLLAQNVTSSSPDGHAAVSQSTASISAPDASTVAGQGNLSLSASGDAESRIGFTSTINGSLLGDFTCTFTVQTTEFNVSGNPQFTFTVTRNGSAIFSTSSTRTQSVPCDAGLYVITVTTGAQVVNQPLPGGSASRTYSFTATLVPRPVPSP